MAYGPAGEDNYHDIYRPLSEQAQKLSWDVTFFQWAYCVEYTPIEIIS